jgi:uncharacterized repeat protein (TIGR03803 family)
LNFKNSSQEWRGIFVASFAVVFLTTLTATLPAVAQTETVVYNFCSLPDCSDGYKANGRLVADSGGNLLGTTLSGGSAASGTVYKLSPDGTETVLYNFGGTTGDGWEPQLGLTIDKQGNFYGVTEAGGAYGKGSVFKISPDGTETILHSFGATSSDGTYPYGPVVLDKKGNIYGSTNLGGEYADACGFGAEGCGTVFRIGSDGKESILHSFNANTDGYFPYGIAIDEQGNLYGTTSEGGSASEGIVYELTNKGVYSILCNFGVGASDGVHPDSALTVDAKGNVYGVTLLGGAFYDGVVFKLTPGSSWTETTLYNFGANKNDGSEPWGGLVLDGHGNLYGATYEGGLYGAGTVFEISPSRTETILYSFSGNSDGGSPSGGLIRDSRGNLYGPAYSGGSNGNGVIYKISP